MKVTGHYRARKIHSNSKNYIVIELADAAQNMLLEKLFTAKLQREARRGSESYLHITFDLPYRSKSYKQLRTIFALVTAIFVSMNGRLPTEEEKYELYLDLLDASDMKRPSKIKTNTLRVIHMSEANTFEAAYFINELMLHLSSECGLSLDIQTDVQSLLWEWTIWRGGEQNDPLDYWDRECTQPIDEAEWRRRHSYSEASGLTGTIHLHHIATRGAHPEAKNAVWNWCALTHEEHESLHRIGEKAFLQRFPHLSGKFKRAQRKIHSNAALYNYLSEVKRGYYDL